MKHLLVFSISIYQTFSPFRGFCRFYPTCSAYAKEVIHKNGVILGIFLGLKRVLRCNPWIQF